MADCEDGGFKGKRRSEQQTLAQGGNQKGLPRKRFYRARAHSNPLSDSYFPVPNNPSDCDWKEHFPAFFKDNASEVESGKPANDEAKSEVRSSESGAVVPSFPAEKSVPKVRFADIGCGFGGLLVKLSVLYPDKLMVGMELRDKVSEYVKERILALRLKYSGQYENISCLRTNAMKYLPNYFEKGQLEKMFFLFPDPHFKEKNHRRRIISQALLAEYAYIMAIGGIIYTITDVEELGEWMKSNLDAHPLFEPLSEAELAKDPVVDLLTSATEEGQKVARNSGETYRAIYRRIASAV
ncbi:tRNA (guanine-N7-)-methyltransferase [Marchantia polymorpha subsp. ruderalis]|uniref:tRNA (guanine-N(7)-)-methyltransferase n=2 Tax=Marchantia polymorpha TaxID=3197 RepID=A0A176VS63_MARPO|nr:hypothetical protein AXG93_2253s1190 [Marchantia polymorpha subsp. ruderalis]PTQ43175.1 hypothetical protein MARPO_0026s0057 [Marchantia polymorpha]PTQ43176.1 hypothetical protein MARPO_0026s0057 [Marchantia polymorpha]BBN02144.1 hypothetical protein Mp_2g13150 [Marchantia polymorpha subsp. ruderalis]BBN02145.1 hypothetical protein Mp_2g13150 [Marchantia polymorpha subsp. ruderalis]|eukprot:PTQ43175.1 hypothetical protein MARPO_0026s0057 [Marchantia polymorpha]